MGVGEGAPLGTDVGLGVALGTADGRGVEPPDGPGDGDSTFDANTATLDAPNPVTETCSPAAILSATYVCDTTATGTLGPDVGVNKKPYAVCCLTVPVTTTDGGADAKPATSCAATLALVPAPLTSTYLDCAGTPFAYVVVPFVVTDTVLVLDTSTKPLLVELWYDPPVATISVGPCVPEGAGGRAEPAEPSPPPPPPHAPNPALTKATAARRRTLD